MAVNSLETTVANSFLAYLLQGSGHGLTALGNVYLQVHNGPPGANAAGGIAGNTTRKQIVCATAPASAQIANTASMDWTAPLGATEQYNNFSVWTATSGGAFLFSGGITPINVNGTTDTFSIPIGAFTAKFTPAS